MFNSIDAILISALLAGNVFGLIIALVRRSNKKKKIQMNKFTFNKDEFADTLLYTVVIVIVVKLASSISNTPVYISMLIISIVSFVALLYFSFFEKRRVVLDKWLAKSSLVFLGLSFLSLLSFGDYYWFSIEY